MRTYTNEYSSAKTPLGRKAECLADDAYSISLDLELARFAAGELCDGYFDLFDENDPSDLQEFTEKLLVGYHRAKCLAQVALHYIQNSSRALAELETAAQK